jgi:site-specific recombinase XerD
LQKDDISFEKNDKAILVRLRISKGSQTGKPVMVRIPKDKESAKYVKYIKALVTTTPSKAQQFFCHANRKPLTRYQFSAVLNKACRHAGLDNKLVKSHSFRIGRATDLARHGMSDAHIKMMGRWSSNIFSNYIRL